MSQRVAIYPGTFDPITLGHGDIIKRALKIVDKLVIGVAADTTKSPIFSLDERVELVKNDVASLCSPEKIDVQPFHGL
jgi:pantetheine-phosphate adenylyltransferase